MVSRPFSFLSQAKCLIFIVYSIFVCLSNVVVVVVVVIIIIFVFAFFFSRENFCDVQYLL